MDPSDYLCHDGKPYQWPQEVIDAGLDHDHIDYFPAGWKNQTDKERVF